MKEADRLLSRALERREQDLTLVMLRVRSAIAALQAPAATGAAALSLQSWRAPACFAPNRRFVPYPWPGRPSRLPWAVRILIQLPLWLAALAIVVPLGVAI